MDKPKKVNKHDCDKYRYTAEKYNLVKDEVTGMDKLSDERFLISWCSFCGQKIRVVRASDIYKPREDATNYK